MIQHIPHIARLIRCLQQVPYLASKNLYRVVTYLLTTDIQRVDELTIILQELRKYVVRCEVCWVWKEKSDPCSFCNNPKRNQRIICVVETWQELMVIEQTDGYQGVYHVLGGVICPLDGVSAHDLSIHQLINRVGTEVDEIIFAMNQTPEGEATSAFIAKKLEGKLIKISCLARGLPVGSSLQIMDKLTLYKSLIERKPW